MKKSSVLRLVCGIPLFSVLTYSEIEALINQSDQKSYAIGQLLDAQNALTVVLSGNVTVTKRSGEKRLLMRILSKGCISGVASLFSNQSEPLSTLTSHTATEVLIIPQSAIQSLIVQNSEFALQYIYFLTSRIRFLNERIEAYTVGDTEAKLALHLLLSDEKETGEIDLPISLTALADILDMGRASLYRALDSLTEKGIIKRSGKRILILNKAALKCVSSHP